MTTQDNNKPIYKRLAEMISSYNNCVEKADNITWEKRWANAIVTLMETAPSGSGIDSGTELDLDNSTGEKIIFKADFHHMDSQGCYDGWTAHKITVTPSFISDFDIKVSGRDRNAIKDYLADVFYTWLNEAIEIQWNETTEKYDLKWIA